MKAEKAGLVMDAGSSEAPASPEVSFADANDGGAIDRARQADLLSRVALRQDRTAFAELFNFYAPRVKSVMIRSGADPALAEEVAQEAMIALWRKAGQFDVSRGSVGAWLFRIAANRRMDHYRRMRVRRLDPNEESLKPADCDPPEQQHCSAVAEARVRRALGDLPPEQVQVLHLSYFGGLSHVEIAETLGLPLGTTKSRIAMAMRKLRTAFAGEQGDW